MKPCRAAGGVGVGVALALAGATIAAARPSSPVTTATLLKRTASWNDVPYTAYAAGQPQLTTVRMLIPAHSALPWHRHVMPNAAYILSGALTVEERATGRRQRFTAGQAFAESVGNVHRGVTGAQPAVVIVTYAGVPGQPLSFEVAP